MEQKNILLENEEFLNFPLNLFMLNCKSEGGFF